MAKTNHERVGNALDLLKSGLGPFVEREINAAIESHRLTDEVFSRFANDPNMVNRRPTEMDAAGLLRLMWDLWNEVFARTLGRAERSIVSELREYRNRWAHQQNFSGDDTYRVLDSAGRLLTAVSAPEAESIERLKGELLRLRFDEQIRNEKRKAGGALIELAASGNLKPWREIVTPHPDVASGRYQQAEFAADLWQVHLGEGSDEYRDPIEFFRRTFLTSSLKELLVNAVQRISGTGGDPVVQLQTNFGGGKTHSMLALYHLFSGANAAELPGVDEVLGTTGVESLPAARRVVLVGNKISPGSPRTKPDGTVVRTLWGELAWQLGGKAAYERVREDDEKATSPGDVLRELFNEYGPCVILIDEWVAYARQLHDRHDLPAGTFETQFTFAQALTESARLANNCLLVISLPASDGDGERHTDVDDIEVGGVRGREALNRLRNVIGRVETAWRPASAEEGFEIVRRRLFEPLAGPDAFKDRDVTARAFSELYRSQSTEFPDECATTEYEQRIKAAFPIHPEIFDQLYEAWSTLVKFQRTRGVLRLMAAVIHRLWEDGDRNPLILPSMIPIDDPRVQFELTRYLSDIWVPIIESDVDGPKSLPQQIDNEVTNFGRLRATRRVARTIYLGSAPTSSAAHQGIEDRKIKLGCVFPGESPAIFGDALRRLASKAKYLYQDGNRFWYSTQPTVSKLAEERAEELKRTPDKIYEEIERRLRAGQAQTGDFRRIHIFPRSGADVPDDRDARLVILPTDYPCTKGQNNRATQAANEIMASRGNVPRIYQNSLIFLAADEVRLQDLEDAVRQFLAWDSIIADRERLNLDPQQANQATNRRQLADDTVNARLPEIFDWLIYPKQDNPSDPISWEAMRLHSAGSGGLAVRASERSRRTDILIAKMAGTSLRTELDRIPLWKGDHVEIRQVVDYFARYVYLPRVTEPKVIANAAAAGISLLTWATEGFAYAEGYDEATGKYRGLRCGCQIELDPDDSGLLVRPEVALRQLEEERSSSSATNPEPIAVGVTSGPAMGSNSDGLHVNVNEVSPTAPKVFKRFHGSVELDATRVGRDAGRIAEEVIAHLTGRIGADVRVTLEIEAKLPNGVTETVLRAVQENCHTLKFTSFGFEEE